MHNKMKAHEHGISKKRPLFGLFLVAVGVFLIFIKLNLIPPVWYDILVSWQMLLIAIGIFSIIGGNKTAGVIIIVIGGFFLFDKIDIFPYFLREISWPILIIIIGLALIFTHRERQPGPVFPSENMGTEYFDDFVIFGGKEIYISSKGFMGYKITSVFGGAEYDLRQAQLSEKGAVIDCMCIFGGCSFILPSGWIVKNEISAIFGSYTDKRGPSGHEV